MAAGARAHGEAEGNGDPGVLLPCGRDSQGLVHLLKGVLRLLEKTKDNRLAELAVILTVIHLQDLAKSDRVDSIPQVGEVGVSVVLRR